MNSRIAVRSGRLSSVPPLRNWSCEALGLPRVRYMPCLLAGARGCHTLLLHGGVEHGA